MPSGKKEYKVVDQVPTHLSDSEVLYWLQNREVDLAFLNRLKDYSAATDDMIASWLNISVRTLRNYRKPENIIKAYVKEQALLLMSLFVHGKEVFGTPARFKEWLNSDNFYFDGRSPSSMLNTVSGIRFVSDRLHAMEYGDNV